MERKGEPREPQAEAGKDEPIDESRRNFLKVAMGVSAILAVGGVGTVLKAITNPASQEATATNVFPKVKVATLSDLKLNTPIFFDYPLDNEPNLIVKLGERANGGIGPEGDIVAFSLICQHLGCPYSFVPKGSSPTCNPSYSAPSPVGYCCCHGSAYDLMQAGKVLNPPAQRPVPQVILQLDSSTGTVFAVGMMPPTIFGHNTGSSDVSADLQGGNPVG